MKTELKATFEERTSKEGKNYKCVVLHIGNYDKVIFLSIPEIALIEKFIEENNSSPYNY